MSKMFAIEMVEIFPYAYQIRCYLSLLWRYCVNGKDQIASWFALRVGDYWFSDIFGITVRTLHLWEFFLFLIANTNSLENCTGSFCSCLMILWSKKSQRIAQFRHHLSFKSQDKFFCFRFFWCVTMYTYEYCLKGFFT